MKISIRHCPHCAQLIHFRVSQPLQCCWNCGQISDLSRVFSFHETLLHIAFGALDRLLPDPQSLAGVAKIALLGAVPATTTMLLICNSFDVQIIYDMAAPFLH